MSVQALTVYESLLASGIDEARARRAAEAIDRNIREQVDAAGEKFVVKDEYAARMEKTPTRAETDDKIDHLRADMNAGFSQIRDEIKEVRTELRSEIAELRREIRILYRVLIGILIGVVGTFAAVTAASAKIIFFGL